MTPPDRGLAPLLGFLRSGAPLPAWTGETLPDGARVGRVLGLGGMCVVFAAVRADGSPCAIKVLLPEPASHAEIRRRFEREARILLSRAIPGLPRGLASGAHDGLPYVIMERIAGRTLGDEMRALGRLEPARAVETTRQILDILARVHRRGIVHRDLKPDNVFLRENGAVCLLDFGVAKVSEPAGNTRPWDTEDGLTRQGEFLGTPAYAAPEQLEDARRARRECDLFSAGVLLLEMLTGRTLAEKPRADRARAARALCDLEGLPERLGRVVERALAVDPRRRFHRARAMANALAGRSWAAFVGWLLDRPTAVVSAQLFCVCVVLGQALVGSWWRTEELSADLVRTRVEAERLARENDALLAQRDQPLQQLLYEDLCDKYGALLRLAGDPAGREAKKFLVACEGFLKQASDAPRRAQIESMRAAIAWRLSPREAEIRIARGHFPTVWGDVPDTRLRVFHNGAEISVSPRIDDSNDPEYGITLRATIHPYDRIVLEVEEGDFGWEALFRVDSAQPDQRLDPVAALTQQAHAQNASLEYTITYLSPPPPLPATD